MTGLSVGTKGSRSVDNKRGKMVIVFRHQYELARGHIEISQGKF